MTANHPLSPIHLQIMWDRLIAVVEEQAQTLVRTGFSTSTREAGDLSAGVFDLDGAMLAQAVTGTPGHINSMARSVKHFLAKYPVATMAEGDVFITNDPWKGTGHLHDFTVVTPTFRRGRVVGLFACTCHVVDIGGRGLSADARQVYEEGLYIPLMKLADRGRMNDTLLDIVRGNVREPVQVTGDLFSLAACNEIGSRRLVAMMDEFQIDSLDRLGRHVLERSREASLAAIAALPHGTYRHHMRVDGYDKPIDICAAMTIGPGGIDVDYAGTSAASAFGINVPLCYTEAYTSFGLRCIVAPKVPNNEGSLGTIRAAAPKGCILNAEFPAPVALRHIMGHMLPDTLFGCLNQALPGRVPAEGAACLWNLHLAGGSGEVEAPPEELAEATRFTVIGFHAGGTGARPGKDGLSATAFPSGVRNVPVEVSEAISPLVFWRKEYRTDSGGPGAARGGLGQVMEIGTVEAAPFAISAMFDRVEHPPRGRDGGTDGRAGVVRLASGKRLKGKGKQTIPKGERLVLEMPGGGGLGRPDARAPEQVARDVRRGLVSLEAARQVYRVALTPEFTVDAAATAALRAAGKEATR